jgi:hypothetical protein
LEKEVMFIENIQLDRDGEWEKEKKKMTACGARDVVVDASSTTKTGWRFRLIFLREQKIFPATRESCRVYIGTSSHLNARGVL